LNTINLRQLLQQLCNVQNWIVKLSQPHIHRASGPKFKRRDKNVKDCKLTLAISTSALSSKRPASAAHVCPAAKQPRLQHSTFPSHVESDSTHRRRHSTGCWVLREEENVKRYLPLLHTCWPWSEDGGAGRGMSNTFSRHWKELDSSHMVTNFDDLGNELQSINQSIIV